MTTISRPKVRAKTTTKSEALEEALIEPDASAQVSNFWASKIDQKIAGEGPSGRKWDVTKV